MAFCRNCGKKVTARRSINENFICQECVEKGIQVDDEYNNNNMNLLENNNGNNIEGVNNETKVGDISFGVFQKWIDSQIHVSVRTAITEQIKTISDDVVKLKKENTDLKARLSTAENNIKSLNNDAKDMNKNVKEQDLVVNNNLKFLIGLNKNERLYNFLLFGVPERMTLTCNDVEAKDDHAKFDLVMNIIGVNDIKVVDMFRLGVEGEKPRPIKVKVTEKIMVSNVLKNAAKLKDLQGMTIYIKQDKTKAERDEFQRLGKKKADLLKLYPTLENENSRVVLKKGILTVDDVQVDRYKSPVTLF